MSVSNKTLAVLLLAAIVVSLGGTFISLNKLGTLSTTGYQVAGENVTGSVNLTVENKLSITIVDSPIIDFGTCQLGDDATSITINSEDLINTSRCDGTLINPIAIRNNGNIVADVHFNVSKVGTDDGGDFLSLRSSADNSSLRYKFVNGAASSGVAGGCSAGTLGNAGSTNTDMAAYVPLTSAAMTIAGINACDNLAFSSSGNSFLAHFEIKIPDATYAGDEVMVTFIASQA